MIKLQDFLRETRKKNPGQKEFLQTVEEVMGSVWPVIESTLRYQELAIPTRIVEPERIISFRVSWVDDAGRIIVNRGYRVQFSSALGPYKGGLRFHPSVNLSILKFLGFEQTFKNALTGLPLGGGKGGSDFDPKGKSDGEVMRFCQNFMTELYRHIGASTDVPAGDIGVGGREIGYLFGQYKKLANAFDGTLTGKAPSWGGSLLRTEATGYGIIYFTEEMLVSAGTSIKGKRVIISGSGNVAQYVAEKAIMLGAKVLTLSDSDGFIFDKDGITAEKLAFVMELKNNRRGRIAEYVQKFPSATYTKGKTPWGVAGDVAFPCATQNEIDLKAAKLLVKNGVRVVVEGANMPATLEATGFFLKHDILFGPSKAANAGGVAVSGLEMSQNSIRQYWTKKEIDVKLRAIMKRIHSECVAYGRKKNDQKINYVTGANMAGFIKVANAMCDQGII